MAQSLPFKAGAVVLQYIGRNVGTESYYGNQTGAVYHFGDNPADKVGYVDPADAPFFLRLKDTNSKPLFETFVSKKDAPELGITAQEAEHVNPGVTKAGPVEGTPEIDATTAAAKLAKNAGIDLAEIEGSGAGGRVLKRDVEALVRVG